MHAGRRAVLEDVAIEVRAGEIVTLIGPNGAGKTTLIRVLLGSVEPARGTVRRRAGVRLGHVPQRVAVDPVLPLTVGRFLRLGRRASATEVGAVLAEVGAARLERQLLHELSGGELQRVLLARALLRRPELLILDEPVQGVDFSGQLDLYELIARLRADHGCGILIVSHDLHVVMAATDRVVCLNRHVCCSGHPEAVTRDPAFVELFGRRAAADLALYSHAHDHRHDLAGEVVAIGNGHTPHPHSH